MPRDLRLTRMVYPHEYLVPNSDQFYLSESDGLARASAVTGLSAQELTELVGRFPKGHDRWPGLKGKVVVKGSGAVEVQHHFTSKVLWRADTSDSEKGRE